MKDTDQKPRILSCNRQQYEFYSNLSNNFLLKQIFDAGVFDEHMKILPNNCMYLLEDKGRLHFFCNNMLITTNQFLEFIEVKLIDFDVRLNESRDFVPTVNDKPNYFTTHEYEIGEKTVHIGTVFDEIFQFSSEGVKKIARIPEFTKKDRTYQKLVVQGSKIFVSNNSSVLKFDYETKQFKQIMQFRSQQVRLLNFDGFVLVRDVLNKIWYQLDCETEKVEEIQCKIPVYNGFSLQFACNKYMIGHRFETEIKINQHVFLCFVSQNKMFFVNGKTSIDTRCYINNTHQWDINDDDFETEMGFSKKRLFKVFQKGTTNIRHIAKILGIEEKDVAEVELVSQVLSNQMKLELQKAETLKNLPTKLTENMKCSENHTINIKGIDLEHLLNSETDLNQLTNDLHDSNISLNVEDLNNINYESNKNILDFMNEVVLNASLIQQDIESEHPKLQNIIQFGKLKEEDIANILKIAIDCDQAIYVETIAKLDVAIKIQDLTPYQYCIKQQCLHFLRYFKKDKLSQNGDSDLMVCVKYNCQSLFDEVKHQAKQQNIDGETALLIAAQNSNQFFFENLFDVEKDITDTQGQTALILMAKNLENSPKHHQFLEKFVVKQPNFVFENQFLSLIVANYSIDNEVKCQLADKEKRLIFSQPFSNLLLVDHLQKYNLVEDYFKTSYLFRTACVSVPTELVEQDYFKRSAKQMIGKEEDSPDIFGRVSYSRLIPLSLRMWDDEDIQAELQALQDEIMLPNDELL